MPLRQAQGERIGGGPGSLAGRWTRTHAALLLVALAALVLLETGLRLGERSPFYRFNLPQFGVGYFWETPLGYTGYVDGQPVNQDSLAFDSLAGFLRGDPSLPVALDSNVYTRLAGYSLLGTALAPLVGRYAGFVLANLLLWLAGLAATYALGLRRTGSPLVAGLAAALVATAPVFSATVGQALPYVASYSLFAVGVWFTERVGLFRRDVPLATIVLTALAVGATLLVYDLYMLLAFVAFYGFRRLPLRWLALFLVVAVLPRAAWSAFWGAAGLGSFAMNQSQPIQALLAWVSPERLASPAAGVAWYASLAGHALVNVFMAFLALPLALALWELRTRWRSLPDRDWYLAVLLAGFLPGAYMLSLWPHLPRWYAFAYPAVYLLAAMFLARTAARLAGSPARRTAAAVALLVPLLLLANLDVLGETRPVELMLNQPERWSYLWSR